jgi:hypothetical protein
MWREFTSVPCLAKKKKKLDRSSLDIVEIARGLICFLSASVTRKKKLAIRHQNRPLFSTTLSIPSYDIGKKFGI